MKILHMNDNPYLNTYNIYGTLMSITSHDNRILPWIYNNFIQVRYVPEWNSFFFDIHHLIFDNCPLISKFRCSRTMAVSKWGSIRDFLIDSIDQGNYIYLYVDRFYISNTKAYKKTPNSWHEILIYGYDEINEFFLVADNLLEGKYIKTHCGIDEIIDGYSSIQSENDFFTGITLLKKRDEDFSFRISVVKDLLNNYLYSKETPDICFKENRIFGFNAWEILLSNIIEKKYIDRRAFHLFWEHKKVMADRLDYLILENYIESDKRGNLQEEFDSLQNEALIIRNMALKYSINKNEKLFDRLVNNLKENLEYEKKLVSNLINNIT